MANFSYTTSGGILDKAGVQVSSDVSQAMLLRFSDAGEALGLGVLRTQGTTITAVTQEIKDLVTDMAECYAAMYAIDYDPSGFTNIGIDATTKLNLLRDNLNRDIDLIKEDKWKTFAGVT